MSKKLKVEKSLKSFEKSMKSMKKSIKNFLMTLKKQMKKNLVKVVN